MSVLFTQGDERVEIPLSEYEAIKTIAPRIAEQNAAVQKSQTEILAAVKSAVDAIAEQQRVMGEAFAALIETVKNMSVTVNVPEQPAPVVNLTVPEQPAPVVNFQPPAEQKRKMKITAKRNKQGFVEGFEGTTE